MINQMRKKTEMKGEITRGKERNEAEGRRNPAAEMGNKSEGRTEGRHPAKVRLACWEGNSQAEAPTPPVEPLKRQEILTKQQNSFSILDLNYSPFPSAVSARTYNKELLRGPPRTLTRAWVTRPCGAPAWVAPRAGVAARAGCDSAPSARTSAPSSAQRCAAMAATAAEDDPGGRQAGSRRRQALPDLK